MSMFGKIKKFLKKSDGSQVRFIDMFAGIGGFRIAFENLGAKCVFSSEINKFARKMYSDNFGEVPSGDITEIPAYNIPEHDILLAGFPCQAFSIAGKKKGFEDPRGNMFFQIIRILKEARPAMFLLENVKGLKKHDGGRTLKVMLDALEALRYKTWLNLFNAKHVVPQNRERLFFMGAGYDIPMPSEIKIDPVKSKLEDILEKDVPDKYTLKPGTWKYLKLAKERNAKRAYGFGYTIADLNGHARTITARYGNDGAECLIKLADIDKGHQGNQIYSSRGIGRALLAGGGGLGGKTGLYHVGDKVRKLTPRECARLMGFPDNYKITVSDAQAYKCFGNSVVVPVVERFARAMIPMIGRAS